MSAGNEIRVFRETFTRLSADEAARLVGMNPVMYDLIEKGAAATRKTTDAIKDALIDHVRAEHEKRKSLPRPRTILPNRGSRR